MGCGQSKNARPVEPTENARPAQTASAATGAEQVQRHDHAVTAATTAASSTQQPHHTMQQRTQQKQAQAPLSSAAVKPRRHAENPIVFFDVAIGGM